MEEIIENYEPKVLIIQGKHCFSTSCSPSFGGDVKKKLIQTRVQKGVRKNQRKRKKDPTLQIRRAFSMTARNLSSDNKDEATVPGATIFFSLNFETATGSKSAKTSLNKSTLVIQQH